MARLETHPHPVDVRELLRRAQEVVEPQAVERGVRFHAMAPEGPVIVSTDPVMAEQVLVNTLSRAVGQAYPGALHVTLKAGEEEVTITLQYFLESGTSTGPAVNLVVAQLADHLGWGVVQEDEPEGRRTIALSITACGPTVLVIDDNEGLVELVQRYLTDHACRVVAAANGQEGLLLAQKLLPDAVVLDVMMPGTHGWEVLQRLRNHPTTADVPVVICSVIDNPELAYSLGATLFLSKPISRDRVLDALRQLGVV
jgi:CheY-like chemotaxis protein